MDSSQKSDVFLPEIWEEAHLRVLRSHLVYFKKSKRLSWESVAQRALLVDGLPKSFVRDQSLRSFGESLRRFANDEQAPQDDRLSALVLLLYEAAVIRADTFKPSNAVSNVAEAFNEFAFGYVPKIDDLPTVIGSDYVNIKRSDDNRKEVHTTLKLSIRNRSVIEAQLKEEVFSLPKGDVDLANDERARRRALKGVRTFHGWCARTIYNQATIFLRNDDYGDKSFALVVLRTKSHITNISEVHISSDFGFSRTARGVDPYYDRARRPHFDDQIFSIKKKYGFADIKLDGMPQLSADDIMGGKA